MKRLAGILLCAALAGLGLSIGNRLPDAALGVVVGVVLGVAATIPLALFVMLRREEPKREEPPAVIGSIPQYPTETYFAGGRYRAICGPKSDRPN